jgi:uroporphyrinogen decarboxylase
MFRCKRLTAGNYGPGLPDLQIQFHPIRQDFNSLSGYWCRDMIPAPPDKINGPAGENGIRFSPGIYEHAAALIGQSPCSVSRDGALLFQAQNSAWQRYRHPMLVAGIDVYNVEPEVLGAGLNSPGGGEVPSIISHPFASVEKILQAEPSNPARDGRMPMILDVAARLSCECQPPTVYVPICGPLAFGNGLVGMNEMLCTMMEDPDLVRSALVHLAEIQSSYVRAILRSGARPLIFESGASPPLLPPALFPKIEAPALGRLFEICRESGDPAPACILGGDVAPVLPHLLSLNPGFLICPSETDQQNFVGMAAEHPRVAVRINMPVASLLEPDWDKATAAADAAITLARKLKNGSVGTGVVPFNTSPDRLLRLRNYVQHSTK